jgi:hypothetical protein
MTSAQAPVQAQPAECIPPPGGKCLTAEQYDGVKKALRELDGIHKAPAEIKFLNPIIIIQDWDGRVYVNGGDKKPVQLKFRLGNTIDRDMAVELPTAVFYRPKPPDPFFRLRIRAQAGLLLPELIRSNSLRFWDAQISFDFIHVGIINLNAAAGVTSVGAGPGIDLTKNFGLVVQYAFVYDGLRSSAFLGCYMSFN